MIQRVAIFFALFQGAVLGGETWSSPESASSGHIAMDRAGSRVYVINPDSNSVSMVDTQSARVLREVQVGQNPGTLAVGAGGRLLYVTSQDSGTLTVLDTQRLSLRATLRVDAEPYGVVASPAGNIAYVASSAAGVIDVIRLFGVKMPNGGVIVARIPVRPKPKGLAISPDGARLYVTHFLTGEVSIIDTGSRRVLKVIQTDADANMSQKIAIHPVNGRAYVPHIRSIVTNPFLLFDTAISPVVSVIDMAKSEHVLPERIQLSLGLTSANLPFDVAFSPDGTTLYSANLGSEDVTVVNIRTGQRAGLIDVGHGPRGIAVSPDGARAYVTNSLSDDVSVLDLRSMTEVNRIPVTRSLLPNEIRKGKVLFFSSRSTALSRDRWMSCASCHFEGEHDGRTWQFTAGPRNTTSLRGAGETRPVHWSADRDEVQDFEFTFRTLQAGSGLIRGREPNAELGAPNAGLSEDLDAMAAFVESLGMKRNPYSAGDSAVQGSIERGRRVFLRSDTGCSGCHRLPNYTDSTTAVSPFMVHNVGTADQPGERLGPAMDTPSLRGVWDTAPYLHDGSAPTLFDVLVTRNSSDRHGRTSHLPPAAISDLIAFLLSL